VQAARRVRRPGAITIVLAKAFTDAAIKVTSVCAGWEQTDLAPGNNGPGTFVDANGPVRW
jgi:hypothetical protein